MKTVIEIVADHRIKLNAVTGLSPEEWKWRYAAQIVERAGWDQASADAAAEAALRTLDLDGYIERRSPEDEADEEISYWD